MASRSLLVLRLYKNLLRAAKPFTAPSPNAKVLNCLLNRTGIDDHIQDWESFVSTAPKENSQYNAHDLTTRYEPAKPISSSLTEENKEVIVPHLTPQRLFRRLLREVVCGGNVNSNMKSAWPSQVDPTILWNVIRREFRNDVDTVSHSRHFSVDSRRHVAFMALRELNKKLSYFDYLQASSPLPLPQQKAWNVSAIPFQPSTGYLRPGSFLLAHPSMIDSYFDKSVICILEHDDGSDDKPSEKRANSLPGQYTYGLIINRPSTNSDTGKQRTLKEALEENMLPGKLSDIFGDCSVREGGPVHISLQMVHSIPGTTEQDSGDTSDNPVGGKLVPTIPANKDTSSALYSDRTTYFQGEIFKAMAEVEEGRLDREDVAFFVGASTWSANQLENEIEQGFWIPCRGPPEMTLTGICEHEAAPEGGKRPLADLWLSMMSACGEDEAKLAHLFFHTDGLHDNGLPCDAFEGDEIGLDDY